MIGKILESWHRSAEPTLLQEDKKKKSEIAVAPPGRNLLPLFFVSYYLVSQLFWRISICCRAFVEGFMCPPTHFSHAPRPRPFPASFSLISLPDKFSHPVIVPSQQPLLWVCLFGVGLVCDYGACHASLDSKREEGKKKTLCKLWEHYEADAGAHKLYGSFAYSWRKALCKYWPICIMDSSCCLSYPVAAFYLIIKRTKGQNSLKKQKKTKHVRVLQKPTASLKYQTERDTLCFLSPLIIELVESETCTVHMQTEYIKMDTAIR